MIQCKNHLFHEAFLNSERTSHCSKNIIQKVAHHPSKAAPTGGTRKRNRRHQNETQGSCHHPGYRASLEQVPPRWATGPVLVYLLCEGQEASSISRLEDAFRIREQDELGDKPRKASFSGNLTLAIPEPQGWRVNSDD